MAARTLPNIGLEGGYEAHEDGWAIGMADNLLKLSVLTQAGAIDKVSAEPGVPAPGDVYILDETHATHPNEVAVYEGDAGSEAWSYLVPLAGWLIYNQTEEYYEKFDGTVWAELATGGGGGTGLPPGGTTGQVLTKQSSTDQDADWETPSGGGGGSGAMSVQDEIYKAVAEANMTMTHGAAGTLFDKVIDKGGFVIFALAGSVRGTTYRAGTTYVVPTGKIAVVVDAKFDQQTLTNPTYYKHRLYNVTTTDLSAGPNGTIVGASATDFHGTYGGNPGPWSAVNVDIPYPTQVGVAGDTLRAEIAGGSDSNDRPTSGIYVVAIIDATTHELEPVT